MSSFLTASGPSWSGFSINGSFHFALHDKYEGCVCVTNRVQQTTPMHEWIGALPACKTQQQDLIWPAERKSWHTHSMGIWIFVHPFWTVQSFCHSNWTTQRIGATPGSETHTWASQGLTLPLYSLLLFTQVLNEIGGPFQLILLINMCDPWLKLEFKVVHAKPSQFGASGVFPYHQP